jgi:small subunit ribosomal protein S16
VAVKLRLMRMGKKKQPTYRVVAADSRSPRDGRFIEIVGTYEPRSEPSVVKIDTAKAVRWLSDGAQPTETVQKLLEISGAWDEFKAKAGQGATTQAATSRAASSKAAAAAR